MASVPELKSVVRNTLESRGVLAQLKARIRAEVFSTLDEARGHQTPQNLQTPQSPQTPLNHQNLLINELLREYLDFNHYRHTSSVLVKESGLPEVPLDRQFLVNELKVLENPSSKSVPLLYALISHFINNTDERGTLLP